MRLYLTEDFHEAALAFKEMRKTALIREPLNERGTTPPIVAASEALDR